MRDHRENGRAPIEVWIMGRLPEFGRIQEGVGLSNTRARNA